MKSENVIQCQPRGVLPSTAERKVATTSSHHMTGMITIGQKQRRVVFAESRLEKLCFLVLSMRQETIDIHEQVRFRWADKDGKRRSHYFDCVVTDVSGSRIAYSIKPASRVTAKFRQELSLIAEQVKQARAFSDVRLLTDQHLDQAMIFNAQLIYGCRDPDPTWDDAVEDVVSRVKFPTSIARLVTAAGGNGQAFRAVVRSIRRGRVCCQNHEKISYDSIVYQGIAA